MGTSTKRNLCRPGMDGASGRIQDDQPEIEERHFPNKTSCKGERERVRGKNLLSVRKRGRYVTEC